MLGINARVDSASKQIRELINNASLPVCLVDSILTEILNEVRMARINTVQKEYEDYQKEQQMETASATTAVSGSVEVTANG